MTMLDRVLQVKAAYGCRRFDACVELKNVTKNACGNAGELAVPEWYDESSQELEEQETERVWTRAALNYADAGAGGIGGGAELEAALPDVVDGDVCDADL